MKCPQCENSDIRRLSVWYASGLTDVDTRTRGVGFLGGLAVFGARTRGTHQTHLSKIARPPAKWSYWRATFLLLIAAVVVIPTLAIFVNHVPILRIHMGDSMVVTLFVGLLACLPFAWTAIALNNWFVVPKKRRAWESKWMCGACHAIVDESRVIRDETSTAGRVSGVTI
jgi:hypothetical protein